MKDHESVQNAGKIDKSWQTIAVSEIHLSFLWAFVPADSLAQVISHRLQTQVSPERGAARPKERPKLRTKFEVVTCRDRGAKNCVAYPMVIRFVHLCSQGNSTTFNMFLRILVTWERDRSVKLCRTAFLLGNICTSPFQCVNQKSPVLSVSGGPQTSSSKLDLGEMGRRNMTRGRHGAGALALEVTLTWLAMDDWQHGSTGSTGSMSAKLQFRHAADVSTWTGSKTKESEGVRRSQKDSTF